MYTFYPLVKGQCVYFIAQVDLSPSIFTLLCHMVTQQVMTGVEAAGEEDFGAVFGEW